MASLSFCVCELQLGSWDGDFEPRVQLVFLILPCCSFVSAHSWGNHGCAVGGCNSSVTLTDRARAPGSSCVIMIPPPTYVFPFQECLYMHLLGGGPKSPSTHPTPTPRCTKNNHRPCTSPMLIMMPAELPVRVLAPPLPPALPLPCLLLPGLAPAGQSVCAVGVYVHKCEHVCPCALTQAMFWWLRVN